MTRNDLIRWARAHDACSPALDWLEAQSYETAQECVDNCTQGDWLLWVHGKAGGCPRAAVRAALACLDAVDDLIPGASRDALTPVRRWSNGEDVSQQELQVAVLAARAAWAASEAAARAADAARVAWAAARAAEAASETARAASESAAWAAWAASEAASEAASLAARAAWAAWAGRELDTGAIVRRHITMPDLRLVAA